MGYRYSQMEGPAIHVCMGAHLCLCTKETSRVVCLWRVGTPGETCPYITVAVFPEAQSNRGRTQDRARQ